MQLKRPYKSLFEELKKSKYQTWSVYDFFIKGKNHPKDKINAILRIDVDRGLDLSLKLAEILRGYGINATFYFLTFPDRYYNIWESDVPKRISEMGFEVGLHSDHYYEQLVFGKDAIKEIKNDAERLSKLISKPVYGMTWHGQYEIDALGKVNWDIYKGIDPRDLGLTYHDGYSSVYLKPESSGWMPNTDYRFSDYLNVRCGWIYYPRYPLRNLEKLKPGESVHITIHPMNVFAWENKWKNPYDENLPKLPTKTEYLRNFIKVRVNYQFKPMLKNTLNRIIDLLSDAVINLLHPFFGEKNLSLKPDPSRAYSIEKIYGKKQEYWINKLKEFGFVDHEKVLEVGFGEGQWLIALSKINKRVYGVEPRAFGVKFTKNKLKKLLISNVELYQNSAENLPFDDNTFDAVLCYNVLQYTNSKKAFAELSRVLKKGGILLVSVDGLGYFLMQIKEGVIFKEKEFFKFGLISIFGTILFKYIMRRDSPLTEFFTFGEIRNLFKKYNFEIIDIDHEIGPGEHPKTHFGFPTFFRCLGKKR